MKKLYFAILMLLLSGSVMAQVKIADLSFDEAIAEAKRKNKTLMVMGSATWCGPCKALVNNVFPSKELGEFMDSRFIVLKYYLDKDDPYNVKKRFNINSYPTFIFLNGEGKEVARMLGGAADAEGFIAKINNAVKPENSWAYHDEQLKKDPDYAMTYIRALNDAYLDDKANKMFDEYFNSRGVEENFNEESIAYYREKIKSIDDKIFVYMLDNKKAVAKVMGKDGYDAFISEIVNNYMAKKVRGAKKVEDYEALIKPIQNNKTTKNDFCAFLLDNADALIKRSDVEIIEAAKKVYKKVDLMDLTYIANAASIYTRKNGGYNSAIESDLLEIINYALDNGKFAVKNTKSTLSFVKRQLTK